MIYSVWWVYLLPERYASVLHDIKGRIRHILPIRDTHTASLSPLDPLKIISAKQNRRGRDFQKRIQKKEC